MGTTGSMVVSKDKNIEMNIEDELPENTKGRGLMKKRHSSQPQNVLPSSRIRNKNGTGAMRLTASLYSIDPTNTPITNLPLPVTVRKENELKITKDQEIQSLRRKEQKLDMENSRLRAELQALNKQCQKLRAERDTATESCHDATERAIALEQDREKIQRQFKIFRETKESEIQALLQEKRKLEAKFHRMQAHGVATGDDHNFLSSAENMKQQTLIPDSPTPPDQWWGAAESETTSLFGSYAQIRHAVTADNNESLADLRNLDQNHEGQDENFLMTSGHWQLTTSSNFGSNSMLPGYTDPEYLEKNHLRCYVTCTPDCQKEVKSLINSEEIAQLRENCLKDGYFLSLTTIEDLNSRSFVPTCCNQSVSVEEVVQHGIMISDLIIFFLGHEAGRYSELECQIGHLDEPGNKSALFCLLKDTEKNQSRSSVCSNLRAAIENSKNCNLEYFENTQEGVTSALKELIRAVKLELGVGTDADEMANEDVRCVEELQLDDSTEQEQREIALVEKDGTKPVRFHKYYERLNELVASPGPLPPLLISGNSGSGKTLLIKTWIECLHRMQQNVLIFQHYVTSRKSSTADPVIMMRRLLSQVCSQLPPALAPPSFALSSYDITHLKSSLPRWLERLSTSKKVRIILALDSLELVSEAKIHFKWLLDPLPIGVRIVISVGVNSCPEAWRQWPTLHLEPLSLQSVRDLIMDISSRGNVQIPNSWEKELTTHCRTASTCHPLYVRVLLQVLCSACKNCKKENLLRSCLKTHDVVELMKLLLGYIEGECTGAQVRQQMTQILQLLCCSRDGLNECEILNMVPGLTWHSWLSLRYLLTYHFVITERAGLICPHNSQASALLREIYVPDKSTEKLAVATMVQYFARSYSPRYPRCAEILPWLVHKTKSESAIRECLLDPYIFHSTYTSSRASEIVAYWKYFDEDKHTILHHYSNMLASLRKHVEEKTEGDSKKKRNLFSNHVDSALSPLMIASVHESAGRFFRDLGQMEMAVAAIQRSLEIRETELDPDHPLVADSLHYLGTAYAKWKKYGIAEPLLTQSLELVECVAGREHPRVVQELQCLYFITHKQERHEQADSISKRILSLQSRRGAALFTSNRLCRLKRRTVKLEELALGQESVNLARAINELGVLCYVQKNYGSAETFLKRSLEMRGKLLGDDHGDVAQCLHNLSAVYNEQKLYDKAVHCMKRALDIRREVFGLHSPVVLSTTKYLAVLYKKSNASERARDVYRELLGLSEQANGEDCSDTATALVNLAVVESQLGQHETALPLYERALTIYTKKQGPTSKQVADTLRNIAVLRYERKDFESAAVLYKKSLSIREELKKRSSPRR